MAAFKLLIIAAVCACVHAFPEIPPKTTIFSDEKLEGGPFEKEYIPPSLNRNTPSPSDYRLPTTTRPIHYNILWGIDIDRLVFTGTVDIELVATQAGVNVITIHADDLTIGSVGLRRDSEAIPHTYELIKELQFMRIILTSGSLTYNAASPEVYTLTISFGSELRDDMYGIYKSWFRNNPDDDVSYMATTQFQATAARYAFPCYDEPSFKATFDITIRRPVLYRSWSGMLQRITNNVTNNPDYEEDVYYRTPIMSTYLLALIVAEYDSLDVVENGTLKYEVIARPEAIRRNQGEYAYRVGQELLARMSEHTGVDFFNLHPYLKMTQASIPDFGAGAMENWGLLTYREAYLMYDPDHTNDYFKQLIAYILSHEIAHMWYGNWVTNEWWDVLWLNEGFARYYQYFLTHWVEDYMGLDTRFITEQVHTALLSDSDNNPQPLTNPGVGSPQSVSAMFSTISYNKGAAVIRMTEHLLGSNVHLQGLRNYLVNRALDVASPIHLFEALQEAAVATGAIAQYGSDFSVIDYYRTWTEQPGHPVIYVHVNHQTGQMTITQRRFNINTGYSSIDTNWIIPITFYTASNANFEDTKPTHIISKSVTVIDRGSVGDQWVIFNKQQTGFYRINYDDYTWDLNIIALRGPNRSLIHEYNRAQIVNDVFQFARSGLMNYTRAFNILSFLENETDYAPWVAAMTGFTWLRNRLAGSNYLVRLESLIVRWASRVMGELSYYPISDESFMRSYLRYQLAPIMCQMNVAACRDAAKDQFFNLRNNSNEVPVNSRNWVYCNALREGTPEDFDYLFERFRTHQVYTEKIQILMVLGCTPYRESLNTFLDAIVDENYLIRRQDYTTSMNSAATGNEVNTQILFDYIKANFVNVTIATSVLNSAEGVKFVLNTSSSGFIIVLLHMLSASIFVAFLIKPNFGNARTPLSYVSSRLRSSAEIQEFQAWANENREILGDDYESVFNNAQSTLNGIVWATQIQDDLINYFDQGDDDITASTPPDVLITIPTTVSQPNLLEPVTPSLPDSAVSTTISFTALMVPMVAYFMF